jgi:hypothetical protein
MNAHPKNLNANNLYQKLTKFFQAGTGGNWGITWIDMAATSPTIQAMCTCQNTERLMPYEARYWSQSRKEPKLKTGLGAVIKFRLRL